MSEPLIAIEIQGKTYPMTPDEVLAELIYSNYSFNRKLTPEITPEEWRRVFPEFTEAMEQRYQAEQMKA